MDLKSCDYERRWVWEDLVRTKKCKLGGERINRSRVLLTSWSLRRLFLSEFSGAYSWLPEYKNSYDRKTSRIRHVRKRTPVGTYQPTRTLSEVTPCCPWSSPQEPVVTDSAVLGKESFIWDNMWNLKEDRVIEKEHTTGLKSSHIIPNISQRLPL